MEDDTRVATSQRYGDSQELFVLRNGINTMEAVYHVCGTFAYIKVMLDTGKMFGDALAWWWHPGDLQTRVGCYQQQFSGL